ncbi:MAG TPA: alpha/beta fold hydrolase [Candidatus Binatia bacterium]|nr:alpha/beta fold hydrolase [Candidatus Binatia bacterium]
MRRDVSFTSEGAVLRGWLYTPHAAPPWPLVVMAHGFSATRGMAADAYAEVFQRAGLAVLLYDHRGFGSSEGQPRHQINPWIQARGYRDAITSASDLEGVDPDRIVLWGDSLSGGVALAVTAVDPRVAALVVQVPAIGSEPPPPDPDGALYAAFRETLLAGNVEASPGEVLGPMPVVSDDQVRRPSALRPLTAYRWFIEYGGRLGSGWVNDVTRAVPGTPVPWHPGLCSPHVSCPALFVVAPQDEMPFSVPSVSRVAFERLAGPKAWLEVDGGHFGLLYVPSPAFDRASSAEAQFLARYLVRRDQPVRGRASTTERGHPGGGAADDQVRSRSAS